MTSTRKWVLSVAIGILLTIAAAVVAIHRGLETETALLASVGTALGTLGLAFFTVRLAIATGKSVDAARDGLALAQEGHEVAVEQQTVMRDELKQLTIQTDAAQRSAEAAHAASVEAAKARIDSISPLVTIALEYAETLVRHGVEPEWTPVVEGDVWEVREVGHGTFRVQLGFRFVNHGKSPATLHFGDVSASMEGIKSRGTGYVVLNPGETYRDQLVVCPTKEHALEGHAISVVVTCNGMFHRAMFDRIQWDAGIRAVQLREDRVWPVPVTEIVNSNGGYVFREYPVLDQPEETLALAKRLQGL